MIMKALLLFLATMGGAGVLYRGQLQSLVDSLRHAEVSRQSVAQPAVEAAPPAESNRLVAGEFHATVLDEPRVRTNRWENTVSTAGGPVVYPVYRTEVVKQVVTPVYVAPRVIVQRPVQRQPAVPPRQAISRSGN